MGASCFSVSGNPAVVRSPAITTIRNMKVHFLPIQEGSGNPSPENVRNTHGWSSINAYQSGMNILPFDDVLEEGWTNTVNGVTATYSHGIMTITGTHTESTWTTVLNKSNCWSSNPIILPPGTYCFPTCSGEYVIRDFCIRAKIDGAAAANVSYTFTAHESVEVTGFYFAVKGEGSFNCTCPVIFASGTVRPAEYKPYVPIKTIPIEMKTIGKNLIHTKYPSRTATGITFTVNADWTITVNGTATAQTWLCPALTGQKQYHTFLRAGTYFMSGGKSSSKAVYLAGRYEDGTPFSASWDEGNGKKYVFTKDIWVYPQICISSGTTVNNETFSIQLERGDSPTAFESYSETSQTVYGGYADPSDGKISAEYVKISVAKEQFVTKSATGIGYRQTNGIYPPTASGVIWNTARNQQTLNKGRISNPYSESTYGDYTGVVFTMENNPSYAQARISEALYQTLEDGEIVEFTYKLATPITYDIPLNGWNVLCGESVYWSDAIQDVDVTYDVADSSEMIKARKRAVANAPHIEYAYPSDFGEVISFKTDLKSNFGNEMQFLPDQDDNGNPVGRDNVMFRHAGKNLFEVVGFNTSSTVKTSVSAYYYTGGYGTTINTVRGIDGEVVITQNDLGDPNQPTSYRNGYIAIVFDGMQPNGHYKVSFDVVDIISNPFNISLNRLIIYNPVSTCNIIAVDGNRVVVDYVHTYNPNGRISMEIRNCGMSCTIKNIMVTKYDEEDYTYEPFVPNFGKNIARGITYSAQTGGWNTTNNYGTTISSVKYEGPYKPLVITQSSAPITDNVSDYHNGYFCIEPINLEFGKYYDVSFKVSDIKSNPLNATIGDIKLGNPYGNMYYPNTISGDRVIYKNVVYTANANDVKFTAFDVRNCGMSFSISEIMITEAGEDQTYVPCANAHYIQFPVVSKNLFPCREEDFDQAGGWNCYFPNPITEEGTYTISCIGNFGGTTQGCKVSFMSAKQSSATVGNGITGWGFGANMASYNRAVTFTVTAEQASAPYIGFLMNSAGADYQEIKNACIQIEKGSEKTFYMPFGSSVIYGAYIDAKEGKLYITHVQSELTAVNRYEYANYFFTTLGELGLPSIFSTNADLRCNRLTPIANVAESQTNATISVYANGIIRWVEPDYISTTSAVEYNTAVKNDRVKIAYMLKDPIIIDIDPVQIKTLLGNNSVFSEMDVAIWSYFWTH